MEYECSKITACKDREEKLTQQLKVLSEDLVEAQRYHTPVCYNVLFNTMLWIFRHADVMMCCVTQRYGSLDMQML